MSLRVVGAGVGRTGTNSLKLALERLLGAPCYHMIEVFSHSDHIDMWARAAEGDMPNWEALFSGYAAAVDWPMASFWPEIADAFPDAIVLLSVRPADDWWRSADKTIWAVSRRAVPPDSTFERQQAMITRVLATRFTPRWSDEGPSKEAYERHNADVRRRVPADRLLEWSPGDGWRPLCDALGVPVPDEPFPHVNTSDDFRAMAGLAEGAP